MDQFVDDVIESVRAHSFIYDKTHPLYKNNVEKEKAWAAVSEACGRSSKVFIKLYVVFKFRISCLYNIIFTEDECKRKWLTLRERLSKEDKKVDAPSGSGAVDSEWPYYDSMQFLKSFIQPRRTRKNTFGTSESNDDIETESESTSQQPGPSASAKKRKQDKFDEMCESIQVAAQCISSEAPPKNPRRKTIESFMTSICDMMETIPELQQDFAMVQILTYMTDLRKNHSMNS